jgi:AcrR family transcriptional regulator
MENPYAGILAIQESAATPAQQALKGALIQLLGQKKMGDITVKQLCSQAYIARSTFYAYYSSIDEVLEDIENDMIARLAESNKQVMNRMARETSDMVFYSHTLALIAEHGRTFYTLLVANPDYRFIDKWKMSMKYHFWERIRPTEANRNTVELVLEITASGAIGAYTFGLTHPQLIDQEETYQILSDILKALDKIR